ncbi:MAG TPA: response regulator, partial [Polyangiaceae bacterium]|nr:response regulator [Polyangiaceae bacterium]
MSSEGNLRRESTGITGSKSSALLPPAAAFGLVLAVISVLAIAFFTFRSLNERNRTAQGVTHSLRVMELIEAVLSTVKDAETGQRGFVLTQDESYARPFEEASDRLPPALDDLERELDNDQQRRLLTAIRNGSVAKLSELRQTVELVRQGKQAEAVAIVRSNRGKAAMDLIRNNVAEIQANERRALDERQAAWQAAVQSSGLVTWGGSALLMVCIVAAAITISRDYRVRERRAWLQSSQMLLGERAQGEQRLDVLGESLLAFLAPHLDARVGALFVVEPDGSFTRVAGYALPASERSATIKLHSGDGLLGQVARDHKLLHVREVPDEFLAVESSLGRAKVRELVLAPAMHEGSLQGLIELGFFQPVHAADLEMLQAASETVGLALRSSKDRTRLEHLLEETQRQAEELQSQQEELRVSNEELEEQGRVLKESQTHLENSQAELEQTNAQLEEQAQVLESQKDELSHAQAVLEDRAVELERSNQYKSEFLANMSHELRTPLNSSLILAKLLSDNKDGNLTAEQVRFAQTISSAGNDLLALINDILDLSKIEAGKVELELEEVPLSAMVEDLMRTLRPLADQKGLTFTSKVDAQAPQRLRTDPQRLAQILKNLLSNALKFTEKGAVALNVAVGANKMLHFEVTDTGIGIGPAQHEAIFEAFRQADGSTHRKYGGTGLGLSIARDLARRMGGDIHLRSAPGEGSTFVLVLPERLDDEAANVAPARPGNAADSGRAPVPSQARPRPAQTPLPPPGSEDDRLQLADTSRTILIIEDDLAFAEVLRDLVREMGFQAVVTHSAADGVAAASRYRISAIVLDMKLPDHSGLGVLEQLKRNPLTRHIPVHVASVEDLSHEALELGAVGYVLKPVKREELIEAIRSLERKFLQGVRRVLVVEDDERQRESVRELLSNGDVEIVGVARASAALEALRSTTFDCIVMDLNLPDLSGYDFLEQLSTQEDVPFPPVIVYTGRSLTGDEEQRLRRFSKSIIIKDAHSPERLLDEVTLFLHQVEATLPPERQRMLKEVRNREAALENRIILIVEDDVRNVFALTSVLEPKGAQVEIARNGKEGLVALSRS